MNTAQFLARATEHAGKLRSLLGNYHPTSEAYARWRPGNITAPGAEAACVTVRDLIAREEIGEPHPIERFDAALASGDAQEIWSLLNSAWFGVPESTECWQVPGFREAVALLEDPPEEEESCPE